MPTFECPDTGETFHTNNVQVTDDGAEGGRIQFKAKDPCPHCGENNHMTPGTVEELDEVR